MLRNLIDCGFGGRHKPQVTSGKEYEKPANKSDTFYYNELTYNSGWSHGDTCGQCLTKITLCLINQHRLENYSKLYCQEADKKNKLIMTYKSLYFFFSSGTPWLNWTVLQLCWKDKKEILVIYVQKLRYQKEKDHVCFNYLVCSD